jgi:hypothetical protein
MTTRSTPRPTAHGDRVRHERRPADDNRRDKQTVSHTRCVTTAGDHTGEPQHGSGDRRERPPPFLPPGVVRISARTRTAAHVNHDELPWVGVDPSVCLHTTAPPARSPPTDAPMRQGGHRSPVEQSNTTPAGAHPVDRRRGRNPSGTRDGSRRSTATNRPPPRCRSHTVPHRADTTGLPTSSDHSTHETTWPPPRCRPS